MQGLLPLGVPADQRPYRPGPSLATTGVRGSESARSTSSFSTSGKEGHLEALSLCVSKDFVGAERRPAEAPIRAGHAETGLEAGVGPRAALRLESPLLGDVGACRGCLAADDRRRLVDEFVILERLHHEQCEVHAPGEVALEDRVADVAAPHGQAWLSPSSRSLPRTTVQRVSLANTRRHASTWSLRSAKRARRASGPKTLTITLSFHEYTSCPSRVMCQPHEKTRRAPGRA